MKMRSFDILYIAQTNIQNELACPVISLGSGDMNSNDLQKYTTALKNQFFTVHEWAISTDIVPLPVWHKGYTLT